MIKKVCILIGFLLLSSACVSRTTSSADALVGSETTAPTEQKLIWFWQSEFYK